MGQPILWEDEAGQRHGAVPVTIMVDRKTKDGPEGPNYLVGLGQYGKYRVVGYNAYNEKHPSGKPLDMALDEAK